MSAYLVSKETIDAIVTFWKFGGYERHTDKEATQTGQMLWEENARSVNARYRENDPTPHYQYKEKLVHNGKRLAPVDIIKLVECWQYQTCETDNYRETPAWRLSEHILSEAIRQLPGYEEAPWGL